MVKIILIAIIFTGICGCSDRKPILITGLEGKALPSFSLLQMDSISRLNTNNIPSKKPIVLFLLNPYCPYCRAETEEISANMERLSGIRFYFVSHYPFTDIKRFYDHYQLNKYDNITVVQDDQFHLINYFKTRQVPYLAIYNSNKELKEVLIGKVSASLIKDIALK